MLFSFLRNRQLRIYSTLLAAVLGAVVVFLVDPYIEGGGRSIVFLQLSLDRNAAEQVVATWGGGAAIRFSRTIWLDYLFACAYALSLASWLLRLIEKKGLSSSRRYSAAVWLALAAGMSDWMENSLELFFLTDPEGFPGPLFTFHSLFVWLKFTALAFSLLVLLRLLIHPQDPK